MDKVNNVSWMLMALYDTLHSIDSYPLEVVDVANTKKILDNILKTLGISHSQIR